MKGVQHHMSLRNYKLKQRDANTHLLEWLKSKTLTTSIAVEDVEKQELSFITDGNATLVQPLCNTFLTKLNIGLPSISYFLRYLNK